MNPWTPPVAATLDIDHDILNLKGKGKWITTHIELPEGYNVSDIYISTIRLNGTISPESKPIVIGDYDSDGKADLMMKFNRYAVANCILQSVVSTEKFANVAFTITGRLKDGTLFEGTDIIFVFYGKTGGKRK